MSDIHLDRETELPQLRDEVYIDNAGAGLPLKSHLKRFSDDLTENLYGNPHSFHTHSEHTSKIVEGVREEIASFLHTDLSQYTVIFTAGTTSACKLVADSFCWGRGVGKGLAGEPVHVYLNSERTDFKENCCVIQEAVEKKRSCYIYLEPNHTSVVGIREGAKYRGGLSICVREEYLFSSSSSPDCSKAPIPHLDILLNADIIKMLRDSPTKENPSETYSNLNKECNAKEEELRSEGFHLLAHPATCNFSGKKYPIGMMESRSRSGVDICGVHFPPNSVKVFIDAAAALSSSEIDLSKNSPHFLAVSFYKLFGFPTGIGALLVRNDTCHLLQKKYFGGGTVLNYTSRHDFYFRKDLVQDFFEEGSISFQSIIALYHGFETFKSLGLSMNRISSHIFSLVESTHSQLRSLKHYNGAPVLEIYTSSPNLDPTTQGNILSFNVLHADGTYVGYSVVNKIAKSNKVSLRVGCFCNIGACQKYMSLSDKDMLLFLEVGHRCGDQIDLVNGVPTGAVRVSFGFYNTRGDADRLVSMIKMNFLESQPTEPISKEVNSSCPDKGGVCITEICIYPIKSCARMKVSKWPVCESGFLYDRTWAILDSKKVMIKQTLDKNLYRIQPLIDLESGSMRLSYPGMKPISIDLNHDDDPNQLVRMRVSGVRVQATASPDVVNQWLSQALGYSVILAKLVSTRYAIDKNKPEGVVDKIPMTLQCKTHVLLTTQASARGVIELARKRVGQFDESPQDFIDRMRGNLVVDGKGMDAFVEHRWRRVSINGVTMNYVFDCQRCEVINIHATDITVNETPMIVIGKERDSTFGVQLTLDIKSGDKFPTISVGDEVVIQNMV